MKLTKSLKAAIVRQFKDGASMPYLATVYNLPLKRVEQVVRVRMIEIEERVSAERTQVAGGVGA